MCDAASQTPHRRPSGDSPAAGNARSSMHASRKSHKFLTSRKSPPRTGVLLPSRQFSSSSSPDTPRTQVVLPSQLSSSSSPDTPPTTVVLQSRQFSSSSSPDTPPTTVALPSHQFSSSHSPATPRTKVVLPSRQFSVLQSHQFSSSSSPDTPRTKVALQSRGLREAEGRARTDPVALSPAFRALGTHDPQRVARAQTQSHSRLRFAHSTRTISAEGCARIAPIALSPAFRALDTHDLRRGLRAFRPNRALACISRTRHARSPQRVARAAGKSHCRLHFAHSTRTISAEGCIFG